VITIPPAHTPERHILVLDFYRRATSKKDAAEAIGMPRRTFMDALAAAQRWEDAQEDDFEVAPSSLPVVEEEVDVEDLVERRKKQYADKVAWEEAHRLIDINIKIDGPYGILHFGDPHVDDDGTDLALLEHHTNLCRSVKGLFAANVGDTTNNWVGRLARLYAEQSTSAKEAWALAEWFVTRCSWLYMIGGNHDAWSGAGDPLQWIAKQTGALYKSSECRMSLKSPNGKQVRVNARHDFAGHSQWNPAHGAMKAAQFGTHDHILVNGHKHVSGYGVIKDANSGVVSHCIQVASYKIYDRYAKERGFRDQHISPCAVTIIDPYARDQAGLVQTFWDADLAADFLTFLRRKGGYDA